jgi:hypothetical protein
MHGSSWFAGWALRTKKTFISGLKKNIIIFLYKDIKNYSPRDILSCPISYVDKSHASEGRMHL